jgi:hypothetical protein
MDNKLKQLSNGFKLYLLISLIGYTALSLIVLTYIYVVPLDLDSIKANIFLTLGVVSVIGMTSVIGIFYFRKWGVYWFVLALLITSAISFTIKEFPQILLYITLAGILMRNIKPIWSEFK